MILIYTINGEAAYYTYNPINPIEMIFTHPVLFNAIVVFFIAFTSGWMVYVIISKRIMKLKSRMKKLEIEKEQSQIQIHALKDQLDKRMTHSLNSTPVINLSSASKANRRN